MLRQHNERLHHSPCSDCCWIEPSIRRVVRSNRFYSWVLCIIILCLFFLMQLRIKCAILVQIFSWYHLHSIEQKNMVFRFYIDIFFSETGHKNHIFFSRWEHKELGFISNWINFLCLLFIYLFFHKKIFLRAFYTIATSVTCWVMVEQINAIISLKMSALH